MSDTLTDETWLTLLERVRFGTARPTEIADRCPQPNW
jgi:hypothetical protein